MYNTSDLPSQEGIPALNIKLKLSNCMKKIVENLLTLQNLSKFFLLHRKIGSILLELNNIYSTWSRQAKGIIATENGRIEAISWRTNNRSPLHGTELL